LTPAHQYPTGATLSADRRAAWISWARHHDAVLIEDDYDGEFRYDRQPVGALAALDPGRVIYGGTTSKTLAPGLRLGWLVLPRRWLEPVTDLRPIVDRHTGALEQLALAEMIASGAYDRHVRHSRMRYRRRRDLLLTLLADQVPAVTPHGIAAGLHTVIDLPVGGPTEDEVIDHLARADVAVHGLAGYHHRTGTRTRAALVVGFRHSARARLRRGRAGAGGIAGRSVPVTVSHWLAMPTRSSDGGVRWGRENVSITTRRRAPAVTSWRPANSGLMAEPRW